MIAFPANIDTGTNTATDTGTGPATDGATGTVLAPALPTFPADTESLGNEIARLAAHLHAATYHLLLLIREFEERGGWGGGFLSCAHWLSWRTGIGPGPAREKVRVARALASLPLISEAMARGELSFSKVRAITRVASPENEAELLEVARHATAAHVEKLIRAWRYVDRLEEAQEEERRHQSRHLRLYPADDGTYVLRGRLDPEVGALLEKALEWAGDALYRETAKESAATNAAPEAAGAGDAAPETETANAEQRRADALGLLVERAMATGEPEQQRSGEGDSTHELSRAPGRADRFQVVLHVEAPALRHAVLADSGVGVPAGTSRRLACDASTVLMTHDEEGRVLDVGRKRRTVPPAIRRALDHRDKSCRFPGCGCRYTDAHHITHWADGGQTSLDNLTLICRRHHRAIHEEGFRVEVVEGGSVRFFRPDGKEIPAAPEPPPLPAEPVTELVRAHKERGITPDAWTPTPRWNGEVLDYGLAIDMFRSLKEPAT